MNTTSGKKIKIQKTFVIVYMQINLYKNNMKYLSIFPLFLLRFRMAKANWCPFHIGPNFFINLKFIKLDLAMINHKLYHRHQMHWVVFHKINLKAALVQTLCG